MQYIQRLSVLGLLIATFSADAGEEPAPNELMIEVGGVKYTVDIDRCMPLSGMLLVRAQSDNGEGNIKVLYRDAQGERGLTLQLTSDVDGLSRQENWDAEGDMITSSSINGKVIAAAGELKRALVRTSVDGTQWKVHPDSDTEVLSEFQLTAKCK